MATPTPRRQSSTDDAADCPAGTTAAQYLPQSRTLPVLRKAAEGCWGCTLYCNASQVVFGKGPPTANVLLVGEAPGDQEDRAGEPFVGPAGRLLDEALAEVGIDRAQAYVTNAVKHFKFEPRGARRIHAKPTSREIAACRPWLEAEIDAIKPDLIICLGATAAQTLLGKAFRVTQQRGEVLGSAFGAVLATVHPSSLLRIPDDTMRHEAYEAFAADLRGGALRIKVKGKAKRASEND